MLRTALIVAVPEAEPAVGRLRATLDRAAAWGVPAHVTVLYPFLPPDRITGAVTAARPPAVHGHGRPRAADRRVGGAELVADTRRIPAQARTG